MHHTLKDKLARVLQRCSPKDRLLRAQSHLKWFREKDSHESVYFYTFHKCASSLFSDYVLKNFQGLRHIDYALDIYQGTDKKGTSFEKNGYVYGPLRLSLPHYSPEYIDLVKQASESNFLENRKAIFFIRDPRDILVSKYFSFGFTHGFSPVPAVRKMQEDVRDEVQKKSLDDYCIDEAQNTLEGFKLLSSLHKSCNRSIKLRYEDMIENWEQFSEALTSHVQIDAEALNQIYLKSRPKSSEDLSSHRRDGKPGSFESKLKPETVQHLNQLFEDILHENNYS